MKRRLAALNLARRVILAVGLAAGLRVAWRYLVLLSVDDGGWFNYVPDGVTVETFDGSGIAEWPALLAIALIAVWTLAAGLAVWPPLPRPARAVPLNPLGACAGERLSRGCPGAC